MRLPPRSRLAFSRKLLTWTVAFGIGVAGPAAGRAADAVAPRPANPRRSPIVEVVERVRASVVNIHSERSVHNPEDVFHTGPSRVNGMGTGIVIDPRGYIITNHHVVEDVQVLRVRLADGASYPARVFARDPETDLALLKVEPRSPLATMPLGTAGDLMIGEPVIAIGNAFGYEHTVTTGIVSATKRDVTLNKDIAYKSLIQTDASINPGNSGGPLVNAHGELIGVNVAIRAGAQGIGFAIPVDQMIRVSADLISGRKRGPSLHGLTLKDRVEPGTSPAVRSLVVDQAESVTQASGGGLLAGDVITKAGDLAVCNSLDFERALLGRKAGDAVPLTVQRDGADRPVELTLRGAPDKPSAGADVIWKRLGLRLSPASAETVHRVNAELSGGMTVMDVSADSPAGRAGLQRGDVLIGLHKWETLTADNVTYVLNHPEWASFAPLKFFIIRGGQVRQGTLQ